MRRVLTALVIAATALPVPARAAVPVLVIDGRGFGHGVGMAQDGAFWMGRAGASTDQILSQFYPGTKSGRSRGMVRVPV
ncbi:MAG: SpoIID/LytB domain-containing protein, partial [Actinomycetota bacterium]|nr:SpoIID/LytB domain-containing protein [Actinomycetota bacterium]